MTKIRCILRKFATTLIMVAAWALLLPLAACTKEPSENGMITMTTKASEVSFTVAGAEDIVIDWGDGKKSNVSDASFLDERSGSFGFSHTFSGNKSEHRITITGDNIESFISVGGNELTSLDVSRSTKLTFLECRWNQLTALDVSRNTALKTLSCDNNQLTTLDVSKNTALKELSIRNNQLTTLDVSHNTALIILGCPNNRLTSVKMGAANPELLALVDLRNNQLTGSALNDLFRELPDKTKNVEDFNEEIHSGSIIILGNPGEFDCDRDIARKRGWRITLR